MILSVDSVSLLQFIPGFVAAKICAKMDQMQVMAFCLETEKGICEIK